MDKNSKDHVHVYDGIVEQNNPMPEWWIWIFILSVIFGAIYWLHYQIGGGPTLKQEYIEAMKEYEQVVEKGLAGATLDTEESLTTYMKNESAILTGGKIFAEKCAMCHGPHLEGKIGPNLTDKYWINGAGTRLDIVHVIQKGSAAKGMPPWEGLLKANEIKNVAAFVYSKIGSNPANPKAAEGQMIK